MSGNICRSKLVARQLQPRKNLFFVTKTPSSFASPAIRTLDKRIDPENRWIVQGFQLNLAEHFLELESPFSKSKKGASGGRNGIPGDFADVEEKETEHVGSRHVYLHIKFPAQICFCGKRLRAF